MKKFIILTMAAMLTLASASTCFAAAEYEKEKIISEPIPITFEGAFSNSGINKMSVSARAQSNDLEKYFSGKSETKVKYDNVGKYNLYYKRAVASSVGYTGTHYLRAYVTGYPNTDTGRVTKPNGFTLYSGWATQPQYPVTGVATCKYGY